MWPTPSLVIGPAVSMILRNQLITCRCYPHLLELAKLKLLIEDSKLSEIKFGMWGIHQALATCKLLKQIGVNTVIILMLQLLLDPNLGNQDY